MFKDFARSRKRSTTEGVFKRLLMIILLIAVAVLWSWPSMKHLLERRANHQAHQTVAAFQVVTPASSVSTAMKPVQGYDLQVLWGQDHEYAQALVQQLQPRYPTAALRVLAVDCETYYQVKIGPFSTMRSLWHVKNQLAGQGIKSEWMLAY